MRRPPHTLGTLFHFEHVPSDFRPGISQKESSSVSFWICKGVSPLRFHNLTCHKGPLNQHHDASFSGLRTVFSGLCSQHQPTKMGKILDHDSNDAITNMYERNTVFKCFVFCSTVLPTYPFVIRNMMIHQSGYAMMKHLLDQVEENVQIVS